MKAENTCLIRGAEWQGIGNKIRDMARVDSKDINEWLMAQAHVAWARSDEANAIARVFRDKIS